MAGEIYPDLGLITTPAATARVPMGTAANAGGYLPLDSFAWKDASGNYRVNGDMAVGGTSVTPIFGRTVQVGNGSINATMSLVGSSAAGYMATFGASVIVMARAGATLQLGANDATAATISTAGHMSLAGNLALGLATPAARLHAKSTGEIARLETTTARGSGSNFIGFRDPTGEKSYFAYAGGDDTFYQMNRMNAGIIFGTNDVNRWQIASNGHFYPQTDNAYSVGAAGARPSVIWSATGTISTSDERQKDWLRDGLTIAERAAARRIFDELGFYQWKDAVEEKGGDAREHFGARAQRVWAIMAEEKLVAPIGKSGRPGRTPYAFLCYDKWDEETTAEMVDVVVPAKFEGRGKNRVEVEPERIERQPTGKMLVTREAGDAYGFREGQLMFFLLAASEFDRRDLADKVDTLDERLAKVEAAIAKLG